MVKKKTLFGSGRAESTDNTFTRKKKQLVEMVESTK